VVVGFILDAAVILLMLGVFWLLDRHARKNHVRLGKWTQFYSGGVRLIDTPWFPIEIEGGCEHCGTSWRYVLPHLIAVRPYGQLELKYAFCEYCHTHMPLPKLEERYAESWLRSVEAAEKRGQLAPDAREWAEIRTMLRVERDPMRVRL
jgi:hypothetical protein